MWKHIIEFSQRLISLMNRVRKLEEDGRDLRQELKDPKSKG